VRPAGPRSHPPAKPGGRDHARHRRPCARCSAARPGRHHRGDRCVVLADRVPHDFQHLGGACRAGGNKRSVGGCSKSRPIFSASAAPAGVRRSPSLSVRRRAQSRLSIGAAAESWRVHSLCVQIRSICTHARPAIWRHPRRGATGRRRATAATWPYRLLAFRRGRGPGGLAEQCCQVIVEDCQCLAGVAGGLDIAGGEGAHDVTPRYPGAPGPGLRLALAPAASTGYPVPRAP